MFVHLSKLHAFYCTFLLFFFCFYTNLIIHAVPRHIIHTNHVKCRRRKRVLNFYDICILCIRVMMIVIISKNEGTLYTINLSQMEIITFNQPFFFFFKSHVRIITEIIYGRNSSVLLSSRIWLFLSVIEN